MFQLEEQAEASHVLRAELAQEQARQQEQQARLTSARERETQLEADRDHIKTSLDSAHNQVRRHTHTHTCYP